MKNAAIAKRQAVASQVFLTVSTGPGVEDQRTTIRSQHRIISPLKPADLDQVAQARKAMGSFKLVTFEQYRKAGRNTPDLVVAQLSIRSNGINSVLRIVAAMVARGLDRR